MRTLIVSLMLVLTSHAVVPLTDTDVGYDQAAYDECVDSAEELDCEALI